MKNFIGLNLEKEKLEQSEKDWKFGALSQPSIINVPMAERINYLPIGEVQRGKEDFTDCATEAPCHLLEVDFNYGYKNKLFKPENMKWLEDNFVQNGQIHFSKRFIAIKSGTTRQGNSMKAPLEAIRKNGMMPEHLLPPSSNMTFDEYMDASKITKEMENLGQEFLKRFTINYEQVDDIHFAEALEGDMLCTAAYAWPMPVNGEYPAQPDLPFNHEFLKVWLPKTFIFDSYVDTADGDFIKKLAPDYKFYEYDYRLFISNEMTPSESAISLSVFQTLLQKGLLAFFAKFWQDLTGPKPVTAIVKPMEAPKPPVVAPQQPTLTLGQKIHQEALKWLGKDASPLDLASDEVGCAESASAIIHNVIPQFQGSVLSTAALAQTLDDSKYFRRVTIPFPGCVIVSPRTATTFGHAGIWTDGKKIISNDSATGTMKINYDWDSWIAEFKEKRGLKILMWEAIG